MADVTRAVKERTYTLRAGLFLAFGLLIAGAVVFLIGKQEHLFDRQSIYRAAFDDVDGLKLDSPVRLGGLEVGHVKTISFSPDLGDKRILVELQVSARFSERIRADSVARVAGRGVLGDKAIDISLGTSTAEKVPNGGSLSTGSSGDLSSILKASGEIIDRVIHISRSVQQVVDSFSQPELLDNAGGVIRSARQVMDEIETGHGAVHSLIYDKKTSQELSLALVSASDVAVRLDQSIAHVEQILKEVHQGEGSLHALIYEKKIADSVKEVGSAAGAVGQLIADVKASRNAAVHQLVYGDARGLFADLGSAASDVKAITSKIRSGEGSLGAIINDPTVYEDLKQVLGNVRRNVILRELVRISISNGENLEKVGKPK